MPCGTVHDETGWMNRDGRSYVLRRDRGGTWRLDLGFRLMRSAARRVGQRVRIVGTRADFDALEVERLEAGVVT